MRRTFRLIAGCVAVVSGSAFSSMAFSAETAPLCSSAKPIRFAEVTWESGQFFEEILRTVLENGYGCKTELVKGASPIMQTAVINGDVDVFSEMWHGRVPSIEQAEKDGKIALLGSLIKGGGGVEGWWVPEYVVKGDGKRGIKAAAPDLKSVEDLKKYAALFKDEEDPSKGRFYNCPTGWQCEKDNTQKLRAYGLNSSYTNFHPGTGAAFDAAITSAYQRGEPIVYTYWKPSAVMGKFKAIQLKEANYNEACWKSIQSGQANPCPSATPETKISVMVNKQFADRNPVIASFFSKVSVPLDSVDAAIAATMPPARTPPRAIAVEFLKKNPGLLSDWVPPEIAKGVLNSLK
ncbi:glycine betaine ABC transporter substrate-binding protein [Burkholderia sp. Ac-20353]|uniref:glycine betaine ABC transporter substrate-binding protein n=1 Tax=Burkholderia sp. Ac-20353 TaxID=2703894 RepID=UPI00197C67E1|nr:glycine betaine ABC transporter substrate-binding protein [Burkholderia sp. Ac-20353]MBN3786538.1 histidine ABC transporter substrate-binding protein [Burkholderia sp. Ac-20353]